MNRILTITAALALALSAHAAHATDAAVLASCYLEVNGTAYIDGPCKLRWADHKGSFFINDGKFEGMAARDNAGAMVGAWYSLDDKSPLRGTFDELHRSGACWLNSTERICAGKPGEHVSPHRASAKGSAVSKATVALMSAWQTMSDECDKESVGGDKIGDKFPPSCAAMQPLSESLAKQGCEIMGNDQKPEAYWVCGGKTLQALQAGD